MLPISRPRTAETRTKPLVRMKNDLARKERWGRQGTAGARREGRRLLRRRREAGARGGRDVRGIQTETSPRRVHARLRRSPRSLAACRKAGRRVGVAPNARCSLGDVRAVCDLKSWCTDGRWRSAQISARRRCRRPARRGRTRARSSRTCETDRGGCASAGRTTRPRRREHRQLEMHALQLRDRVHRRRAAGTPSAAARANRRGRPNHNHCFK